MSCWKPKALQSLPLSCTAWGGAQGCGDLSLRALFQPTPLSISDRESLPVKLITCLLWQLGRSPAAAREPQHGAPLHSGPSHRSGVTPGPPPGWCCSGAARRRRRQPLVLFGSARASCEAAAAPESPAACRLPSLTAFQCCPISHALLSCRHMSSSQAATRRRSATASPASHRVNASAASLATDDVQVIPPATGSYLSILRLLMHHCTASWRLHCCPQGVMLDKPSVANKNWARVAAVAGAPAV